jgi:hypothetical protein
MNTPRWFVAIAMLGACGGDDSAAIDRDCNPLGGHHCMAPWPSSAFEIDDATTATGRRIDLGPRSLPSNSNDEPTDPGGWNEADGFSSAAPIVIATPGGFSVAGLPPHTDFTRSLAADSPTVIVDLDTGERVVHFAELDAPAEDTPDRQALYLRPAARLIGGHRYAVIVRSAVRAKDGSALPRTPAFDALVNGRDFSHPRFARLAAGFPAVRAAIDAQGIPIDDVWLAWDFTVASDEYLRRDPTTARDLTIAWLDANPQTYSVISDEPVDADIARRIDGEFDAPLFLTNDGNYVPRTVIARDAAGLPEIQGTYRIPFTAIIPQCALDATEPVGMIIYGHGLNGTGEQAASGALRDTARDLCMVIMGTDMRGMSSPDVGAIARALTGWSYADEVFEALTQGIVNHVALARAARTVFASELFVHDPDGAGGPMPPASVVDPAKLYYYGLSQGHIFGTVVMAYEPTIMRGVIGVGGGNYSLMLERSTDWPDYRDILLGAYPDPLDLVMGIALFQARWDKTETAGISNVVLTGGAGAPPKQLLLHMALADDEVPNLATEWQARTMGIPVLSPTVKVPYGIPEMVGPIQGSGLTIFDGGVAPPPDTNVPAPDTGAHGLTRVQPAAKRQMAEFYATGTIVDECGGPCVCTPTCE